MKFSICIPNYNYERFIVETIRSVLTQDADLEVLVSDNNSTDNSVAAVEAIGDERIRVTRNAWNVGFAGNLDRACAGATGDRMILLSSDDIAGPEALATYAALADRLGQRADRAIFGSAQHVVDESGKVIATTGRDERQWQDARIDPELSDRIGAQVLRVPAKALLARALSHLRTPFNFLSTCYPRSLYELVEGYGGGYLYNPDKAFVWKILGIADEAFFIDKPLFSYRVHSSNQAAQQRRSGALKHLMDQYRATFDLAPEVLTAAGMDRRDLARAFIEHDVALRGLKHVAEGERVLARRGLDFGRAAYPDLLSRSAWAWALRAALAVGPLGTLVAGRLLEPAMRRYRHGDLVVDHR